MKNTGKVAGDEIAQVYVTLPAGTQEPPKRLVGWSKLQLGPGEEKSVTVQVEPLFLSVFNVDKNAMQLVPGAYKVRVGSSSRNLPLSVPVKFAGN